MDSAIQTLIVVAICIFIWGNAETPRKKQQGQRIVKQLTNFWNNSGRCVTTDNFFMDLSLGEELLKGTFFGWHNTEK